MILQEGEEKKQKKPQSSVFPPNKGEEHRAALSPHSLGVAQHQDDRVPPEEHLGDEPVPRDPRPPRARSLRRGPSCFRRVRPHLFDVLEDHVAVAVEGLGCGGEGFVFFFGKGGGGGLRGERGRRKRSEKKMCAIGDSSPLSSALPLSSLPLSTILPLTLTRASSLWLLRRLIKTCFFWSVSDREREL